MAKKRKTVPVGNPPQMAEDVEVVEFQDRFRKRDKPKESVDTGSVQKTFDPSQFNLRRARHEVFMLGVSGMEEKEKDDANIGHAIKLGAYAPKKKFVNYKLLLEEKKKKQELEKLRKLEAGTDKYNLKPLAGPSSKESSKKTKKKKKDTLKIDVNAKEAVRKVKKFKGD